MLHKNGCSQHTHTHKKNRVTHFLIAICTVPPEETEASPEKTEHNVLMSCCALEEIEELLTKLQTTSQIAKTSAESITASCLRCRGTLQRYKAETEKRTEELIRSFLGNDLRMKAVDAHRTISAQRRQKSLSAIADVRERYDKQWEHEAQQRAWLSSAAAGNGAVSSIANAIVPQALLALGKTLNDEHGPMEEYRTAYGPRVKDITARLRRTRRAVSVAVAFDNKFSPLFLFTMIHLNIYFNNRFINYFLSFFLVFSLSTFSFSKNTLKIFYC